MNGLNRNSGEHEAAKDSEDNEELHSDRCAAASSSGSVDAVSGEWFCLDA
jgi:hypothetical protein